MLLSCLSLQVVMLVASLQGLNDIVNGVENQWIYFTYNDFDYIYPLLATGTEVKVETYDTSIWTSCVVCWSVSIALTTSVLIFYVLKERLGNCVKKQHDGPKEIELQIM